MVALKTGAIDATVLTPELAMITHKFGSRTLLDFVEKGMEYQHIALMGRSDFLKSQNEPVKRFMRGEDLLLNQLPEGVRGYHRHEQVVAVGFCLPEIIVGDISSRSRLVLNDHRNL